MVPWTVAPNLKTNAVLGSNLPSFVPTKNCAPPAAETSMRAQVGPDTFRAVAGGFDIHRNAVVVADGIVGLGVRGDYIRGIHLHRDIQIGVVPGGIAPGLILNDILRRCTQRAQRDKQAQEQQSDLHKRPSWNGRVDGR